MADARGNLTESVRFRVTPELKKKWDAMLADRRLSLQDAAGTLFEWITAQDPLTQAMILNQVPDTDHAELSRIVLRRLASRASPKGKK